MQSSKQIELILSANAANIQSAVNKIIAERDLAIRAANAVLSTRASKYLYKNYIDKSDLDSHLVYLLLPGGIKFRTGKEQQIHILKFDGVVVTFGMYVHERGTLPLYRNRIEISSPLTNTLICVEISECRLDKRINGCLTPSDGPVRLSEHYEFNIRHDIHPIATHLSDIHLTVINKTTKENILKMSYCDKGPFDRSCETIITISDQNIRYMKNNTMMLE